MRQYRITDEDGRELVVSSDEHVDKLFADLLAFICDDSTVRGPIAALAHHVARGNADDLVALNDDAAFLGVRIEAVR